MESKKHRKKSGNLTRKAGNDKGHVTKGTNHTPPITTSYEAGMAAPIQSSNPMTQTSNGQTGLVLSDAREVLYGADTSHQNLQQMLPHSQNHEHAGHSTCGSSQGVAAQYKPPPPPPPPYIHRNNDGNSQNQPNIPPTHLRQEQPGVTRANHIGTIRGQYNTSTSDFGKQSMYTVQPSAIDTCNTYTSAQHEHNRNGTGPINFGQQQQQQQHAASPLQQRVDPAKYHFANANEQCKQTMYTGYEGNTFIVQNQDQSEVPAWVASMLKSLEGRLQNIESQITQQNLKWQQIDSQLQQQNTRMNNFEQKFSHISVLKNDITQVQVQVSNMETKVRNVESQMLDFSQSVDHFSEICDDITYENSENKTASDNLIKRISILEQHQAEVLSKQSNVEEKITDLQCRSMRDNLLFTGIQENDSTNRDTEDTLCTFIATQMNIKDEIPFERVHRLGRYKPDQEKPRPIIAKFHRFKDREKVRQSARDTLTGTQYGVKEQFPIEVEAKRRTLYPIMKKARENKENKVRMVRDRLFINDNEVAPQQPPNLHQPKQLSSRQNSYREQRFQRTDRPTNPGQIHQRTRVFTATKTSDQKSLFQFNNTASDVRTPKRFAVLFNERGDDEILTQTESRKKKASSPLENETNFKKTRDTVTPERHQFESSIISLTEPMEAQMATCERATCRSPEIITATLLPGPTLSPDQPNALIQPTLDKQKETNVLSP